MCSESHSWISSSLSIKSRESQKENVNPDEPCKEDRKVNIRPVWVIKSGSRPTMELPSSFLVM